MGKGGVWGRWPLVAVGERLGCGAGQLRTGEAGRYDAGRAVNVREWCGSLWGNDLPKLSRIASQVLGFMAGSSQPNGPNWSKTIRS